MKPIPTEPIFLGFSFTFPALSRLSTLSSLSHALRPPPSNPAICSETWSFLPPLDSVTLFISFDPSKHYLVIVGMIPLFAVTAGPAESTLRAR